MKPPQSNPPQPTPKPPDFTIAQTPVALRRALLAVVLLGLMGLAGCAPTPTTNVVGYLLKQRLGTLENAPVQNATGAIAGRVIDEAGNPISDVVALVAEATGTPYHAITDANGEYRIEQVPPGQYVPAFVAPGYAETALHDRLGPVTVPRLLTVRAESTTRAPLVALHAYTPPSLPNYATQPLAQAVALRATSAPAGYVAQAGFPAGAAARVHAYTFTHNGNTVDTLRLYLPLDTDPATPLPLLFMIYPTDTAAWEEVSAAYAAEGFAFVAISPIAAHGTDIDAHAQDARVAFHLARDGHLPVTVDRQRVVALGGSFSSTILHRFLRDEGDQVAAWVNVGGITNAFTGAAEFYAGELTMPPDFEYAIPALGPANIYPLPFLRFSPVYTARRLPPTYIVHTAADRIATIDQAYQLEAALRAANVPVATLYYADDSHYLMIGDAITPASKNVYYGILDYIHAQTGE